MFVSSEVDFCYLDCVFKNKIRLYFRALNKRDPVCLSIFKVIYVKERSVGIVRSRTKATELVICERDFII
jgi:hypothetical protein